MKGRGLYGNSGVVIGKGEAYKILGDGLILPSHYTITLWMIFPFPFKETELTHTLFSGKEGIAHFFINKKKTGIGIFDDKFVLKKFSIKDKFKKGWNSIAVIVNNHEKHLEIFINKLSIGKSENLSL